METIMEAPPWGRFLPTVSFHFFIVCQIEAQNLERHSSCIRIWIESVKLEM